jgi:hypothetical protein
MQKRKKRLPVVLTVLLLTLGALHGAEPSEPASVSAPRVESPRETAGKNFWRVSVAALIAANIADVKSSWGKQELNPVLATSNGKFGGEAALLKLGLQGGAIAVEYLLLRRHPSKRLYRALTFVNFGDASVTGAMAARNFGIPNR